MLLSSMSPPGYAPIMPTMKALRKSRPMRMEWGLPITVALMAVGLNIAELEMILLVCRLLTVGKLRTEYRLWPITFQLCDCSRRQLKWFTAVMISSAVQVVEKQISRTRGQVAIIVANNWTKVLQIYVLRSKLTSVWQLQCFTKFIGLAKLKFNGTRAGARVSACQRLKINVSFHFKLSISQKQPSPSSTSWQLG